MTPSALNTFTYAGMANYDLLLGGLLAGLLVGVAVYARAVPQGDRRWWGLLGILAALVIASQAAGSGMGRSLLLDAAALAAVAMVWWRGTPGAMRAAERYFQLLAVAAICLGIGLLLTQDGTLPLQPLDKLAIAFLLVGGGLKLALVPFYFWLPGVAEHAAPMTTALIVSVVDVAAFAELAQVRLVAPWVFTQYRALWLGVALVSMLGGALLALAQRNLKRLLAFSTVDDMGYLLLGVVAGPGIGLDGALLAALSHALFKVLLFGAVGVAESGLGRAISLDDRGLAARYPWSGAAFIVGALGLIGVPPFFGFVGRWRLYLAGIELGGLGLVLAMALATGLALLYYVRAIHQVWLGRPSGEEPQAGEPWPAVCVLALLMALSLLLGLFPAWVTGLLS